MRKMLYERTKIVIITITISIILFLYYLLSRTSVVSGVNDYTDDLRESTLNDIYRKFVLEGSIIDSTGNIISEATEKSKTGSLVYPEAYSWLIGYNDVTYGTYGLKGRYEEYLYMPGEDGKGATIQLAINDNLQRKAYELISGTEASAIVLNTTSGEILTLASSKKDAQFNANEINECMEEWNKIDGFFLPNGYKDMEEPGSVFKIVTASSIVENNMENNIIQDLGTLDIQGHTVRNSGKNAFGSISLQDALGYSSNVYFAQEALLLGESELNEKGKDFLVGEDIELDFTTLKSNWNLDNASSALLADTAYGQGKTLISPLQIAMIGQAVANDGKMLKPYLVENITLNGNALYEGEKACLTQAISEETSSLLEEYLNKIAEHNYGINLYNISAKTGTAELPNGYVKKYFLAFNQDYVVLISQKDISGYGIDLKDKVMELFSLLYQ